MAADSGHHVRLDVEESHSTGNKVQPFSSTPRSENRQLDPKKQAVAASPPPLTLSQRLGLDELFSLNVSATVSVHKMVFCCVLILIIHAGMEGICW